jgi:hypothetical protein
MKVQWLGRWLAMIVLFLSAAAAAQPRPPAPTSAGGEANAAAAKKHATEGKALLEKGEYPEALEKFLKALELRRSPGVLANLGQCLEEMGRYDEALEQYEELLRDFKDQPADFVADVKELMKKLDDRVGTVVLAGDTPEGASIFVDDRRRGKLPLTAPLRLSKGLRKLRVEREGFEPITASVEVSAGKESKVTLAAKSRVGLLVVTEKHNWRLQVEVDGKDMGATPWQGLVGVGEHRVRLHGYMTVKALLSCEVSEEGNPAGKAEIEEKEAKMDSGVESVRVGLYEVKEVPLRAEQEIFLKVASTPEGARLWVDDKEVGQTPWEGGLALGDHTIEVRATGYITAKQQVKLERGKQREVTVALEREPDLLAMQTATRIRNVTVGVSYGLGALSLVLGAVTGSIALEKAGQVKERCGNSNCPTAESGPLGEVKIFSTLSTMGFVVGVLGAAGGTIALLTLGPKATEPKTGVKGGGASRPSGGMWSAGVGPGRFEIKRSF